MNEVGVDPGIDHLLAMECFDEVRAKNGKVSMNPRDPTCQSCITPHQ